MKRDEWSAARETIEPRKKDIGRAPSAPRPLHFPQRRNRRAGIDALLSSRSIHRALLDAPFCRQRVLVHPPYDALSVYYYPLPSKHL
jgi:hypothetical protein